MLKRFSYCLTSQDSYTRKRRLKMMTPREAVLVLKVLSRGEWSYKADGSWRVFCESCGAEYSDSRKTRHHKRGCEWRKAWDLVAVEISNP